MCFIQPKNGSAVGYMIHFLILLRTARVQVHVLSLPSLSSTRLDSYLTSLCCSGLFSSEPLQDPRRSAQIPEPRPQFSIRSCPEEAGRIIIATPVVARRRDLTRDFRGRKDTQPYVSKSTFGLGMVPVTSTSGQALQVSVSYAWRSSRQALPFVFTLLLSPMGACGG